jgi:Serine/threonine protein kinase
VYLARARSTGELVAVKHLRAGMDDLSALGRFRREAHAMAALDHPNVLRVRGLVEQAGECFLIMEYVPGPSLRLVLDHVDPATGCAIVGQLAEALDAVHGAGIVHRDVKPSNVLLASDGSCKLADFGVARYVGESLHGVGSDLIRTRTGTVLGTPAYMAPEVAAGLRDVDGRADVYSLGILAYLLCVGRLPFEGTAYELLTAQIRTPPPRPTDIAPGIPPELDAVLFRALAKDPAERYPTAGAFADALLAATPPAWTVGSDATRRALAELVAARQAEPGVPETASDLATISVLIEPPISLPDLPPANVPIYRPRRVSRRRLVGAALVAFVGVLLGISLVLALQR